MKTIIGIVAVLVIFCGGLAAMNYADHREEARTSGNNDSSRETYEIDGVHCYKKQNIDTYYFMGIDAKSDASTTESDSDHSIQNDVNLVLVIDRAKNTYTVLALNRDSMVDIEVTDENYNKEGETTAQLALAFAYGDGKEKSCELAEQAVSKLLYGQKINGYMALNMDAIGQVNHLLGGVTVEIEDKFPAQFGLTKGESVRLTDEQAEEFVRGRKEVADGTNENRMKRQQAFLEAAKPMFIEKCREDSNFATDSVQKLSSYSVTNLTNQQFSKIAKALIKDTEVEIPEIKYTSKVSDVTGFVENTLDQDSLAKTVIDLFYEPVDPFEYDTVFGEDEQ